MSEENKTVSMQFLMDCILHSLDGDEDKLVSIKEESKKEEDINIEFKINGIELDFEKFILHLEKKYKEKLNSVDNHKCECVCCKKLHSHST